MDYQIIDADTYGVELAAETAAKSDAKSERANRLAWLGKMRNLVYREELDDEQAAEQAAATRPASIDQDQQDRILEGFLVDLEKKHFAEQDPDIKARLAADHAAAIAEKEVDDAVKSRPGRLEAEAIR